MSSIKSRGRSAVLHEVTTNTSPLISNIVTSIGSPVTILQQQYVPSLLKIESVVPIRLNNHRNHHHRTNRLITRSYSTLCNATTITTTTTAAAAAAAVANVTTAINYKNVTKKINTNLHRSHKNHNQRPDAIESPISRSNNQHSGESGVILENGIYKIRRTTKEKEKQPDRINLDRRGLSTIPLIETEPNLRLLSLQHNLINAFHIPEFDANNFNVNGELHTVGSGDSVKDYNNNVQQLKAPNSYDIEKSNNNLNNPNNQLQNCNTTSTIGNVANMNKSLANKPFLKQKSTSRNQLNLNFNSNNGNMMHTNVIATPTSFLQKSFMLQSKNSILKRANSVMINYTPSPTTSSYLRSKLMATPSFSILDTHNNHDSLVKTAIVVPSAPTDNTNPIQIDVSNNYMSSFRFNLSNLVFLDLYNNQIEKISNLDGLKSLTVLLLGKNRISDISGIVSLKQTLRVLDLHGNRITHITQKICQLQELKSLNLAGNLLRQVYPNDFAGLFCLKELNLKRNRIKKINGFDDLHNLERLWLCHNDLQSIEDMNSIAKSINLKEITIENNPISLAGDCVSFLVSYLPLLMSLNQLQITEQVRRAANAWRRGKENTDQNFQNLSTDVSSTIRREEIISNARTNWELIRSQQSSIINGQRIANPSNNSNKRTTKPPMKITPNISSSSSTASSNLAENGIQNRPKHGVRKAIIDSSRRPKSKLVRSSSIDNTNSLLSGKENEDNVHIHLPPLLAPYEPQLNPSASSMRPNVDSSSSTISSDTEDLRIMCKSKIPTTPPINPPQISQPASPMDIIICDNYEGLNNELNCYTPPLPPVVYQPSSPNHEHSSYNPQTPTFIIKNSTISPISPPKEDSLTLKRSRSPTPTLKDNKLTLTIIDSCNGVSLQPTVALDTERNIKSINQLDSRPISPKCEQDADKLSVISKNSAKTSTDSINTLSSTNDERNSHSIYNRHKTGVARKLAPTLVRSQTARNLSSSHMNNQAQNNISNNNQKHQQQQQQQQQQQKKEVDKDREQGGDYLVEICGRYLNVYGVGAVKYVDKQWNIQKANDVHTVKFSYINFNSISPILGRVKVRFPNAENYVFRETNMTCLGQLNALADTQGLKSITIDVEGNPLAHKNWRLYAIYRLGHWGLKQINGIEITEEESIEAENTYGGLSDLVLWSLPDSLLQPLFVRLNVEEVLQNNKITAKEWLMRQADESIRHVVGKEALQWKKNPNAQDEITIRRKGKAYFSSMMENTCNAVEKLQKLDYLWPNVLVEMIRNTLIDYSQIELYVRNLMNEVLKDNPVDGTITTNFK
ncbi:unnamed protein product [Diamesa serratosioi]